MKCGCTWVVYGYSSSHICGGAVRWCYRKWRDRKWPCPEVCYAHAQPEIAPYPPYCGLLTGSDKVTWPEEALTRSMFWACATWSCAISTLLWPFDRKWQSHVTGRGPVRKCSWPEVGSAHARVFPRFFLRSSNMATWCDRRSLDPLSVFPLGVRNRKLHNTRSSSKQCWLGCSLRRPRLIFSRATGTKHPHFIFSMVTGTSPGYLPLLFSYSVYIGCVVLLRVHLKISTYKNAFYIFTLLMFKIRQQLTKIKSINSMVDL